MLMQLFTDRYQYLLLSANILNRLFLVYIGNAIPTQLNLSVDKTENICHVVYINIKMFVDVDMYLLQSVTKYAFIWSNTMTYITLMYLSFQLKAVSYFPNKLPTNLFDANIYW